MHGLLGEFATCQCAGCGQFGLIPLHHIHKGQKHVLLYGHEGVPIGSLKVEGDVDLRCECEGNM